MDSPGSQLKLDYSESQLEQDFSTDHLLLSSQLNWSDSDVEEPGIGAQPLEASPRILPNENELFWGANISSLIGSMYETELALMTPQSRKNKDEEMVCFGPLHPLQ